MLTGYNTDFKFQGKIYHVQTEDGGSSSPSITSLLYYQGEIIASRKTSYADILKADCLGEVVRELMMEQHKQIIRDLMQGKLDISTTQQKPASQPASGPKPAPVKEIKPEPQPVPPATPEEIPEKSLDDIILEFLAQEQKEREQQK